jgi:tRNA 2-thiouridine synthesizing protein B
MLHTVNKSPFEKNTLESCLQHARSGSSVLLIEDGVYAAVKGSAVESRIRGALERVNIYVLAPDLRARGMEESQVIDGVALVDYGGFVDLAAEHDKVQSWL